MVVLVVFVVLDDVTVSIFSFCRTLITSGTAEPMKQIVDRAIAVMINDHHKLIIN